MKDHDAHIQDPGEFREDEEALARDTEFKQELRAKGIDYGEYMADQQRQKKIAGKERLAKMGIKIEAIDAEEFNKTTPNEEVWQDTCESEYVDYSRPIKDAKGKEIGFEAKRPSESKRKEIKENFEKVKAGDVGKYVELSKAV